MRMVHGQPIHVRCPSCGTAFQPPESGPTIACINCRYRFARPIAASVGRLTRPRYPFVYQDLTNPKMAEFRRRHRLDEIVDEATDELDALIAVRDWTFSRFRCGDPAHWRLDADSIIDSGRNGGRFHCAFYTIVAVQAHVALGHTARRINVDVAEADPRPFPHMVYDVWCNQLDQWVVMDAKANIHFEIDGRPLSALQLRCAHMEGRDHQVDAVFGRGKEKKFLPKAAQDLQQWAAEWYGRQWGSPDDRWSRKLLDMADPRIYSFIGVYGANDLFSRPVSPNHLKSFPVLVYYDDRNREERWWQKPARQVECYAIEGVACRVEKATDIEWPVNRCELQASPAADGEIRVNTWTDTPNFSHFEYRHGSDHPWAIMELTPADDDRLGVPCWTWRAVAERRLQVRSVNLAGGGGVVAELAL